MKQPGSSVSVRAAHIGAAFAFIVGAGAAAASSPALPTPVIPAQAAPAPADTGAKPAGKPSRTGHVETRIKELHSRLKITKDQEDQWNQVAQVMRDNAKTLDDAINARRKNAKSMTAVDNLKSYSAITEAHAEGVKKFIPVFEALYDKMSNTQKKTADALFRNRMHRRAKSAPSSAKD